MFIYESMHNEQSFSPLVANIVLPAQAIAPFRSHLTHFVSSACGGAMARKRGTLTDAVMHYATFV